MVEVNNGATLTVEKMVGYLSGAYGDFPKEDFDDAPVLWIITVDDLFEPPFGSVAYAKSKGVTQSA